jgi:hypothetical protein
MIRMEVIVNSWTKADKIAAQYAKALDQLPTGQRLFTAFPDTYSDELGSFKMYLPCLAIISRAAFVPSLYSMRGGQPVLLTPSLQSLKANTGGPGFRHGQLPDWPLVMQGYDYLLVADKAQFSSLPIAQLQALASGPDFHLYRVLKR